MDNNIKRVFLIVLDSFGIGEAPDAAAFGDVGSDTLGAVVKSQRFNAPNLTKLGLFSIEGQKEKAPEGATDNILGAVARLRELSNGKDTTIGHWEMAGIVSEKPLPTYPNGFPKEVIDAFKEATGRGVLCNLPYSGTQVLADYGEEHLRTGDLIVYTSSDSVFQIAAHESLVSPEQLYEYCRIARKILVGDHAVGRVIARPFEGEVGNFTRTPRRHDFSLEPTEDTMLDSLKAEGFDVIHYDMRAYTTETLVKEDYATDGLHPVYSGYAKIADAMRDLVKYLEGDTESDASKYIISLD
jgi:phosphopentomutase